MEKFFRTVAVIIVNVVIPFLIGWGIGGLIRKGTNNVREKEIAQTVSGYETRLTSLQTGVEIELQQAVDSTKRDAILNEYILKGFNLHEQVYRYTVDKRLLDRNSDLFNRSMSILNSIYNWQMTLDNRRLNFFTGTGLSSVYTTEAERNLFLTNAMTAKTCEEVLKVDPNNSQAQETLNRVLNSM